MKIIFVTSTMNGGGAERVIATLANRFVKLNDEVTILMTAGDGVVYPLDERVGIFSIGQPSHGNPFVQIKRVWNMRRYFKNYKDDKIISFSTKINLFTIISCLGLKNIVIVSERNDPNICMNRRLRDLVYPFADRFVFQTEDAKACFSEKIRKRSAVIPNPIREGLPEVWEGKREKKIGAVGRLEPQKNHMLLLEAFAGFHQRFPEYELHIFGKGSLEEKLKTRAVELKIADKVIWEGFRKDVLETIRTYEMYVLSSNYEGISNSLLEAMALGLPCISTDCPIGGSTMCIEDGVNGLLVPVGDKKALQKAMERLAVSATKKVMPGDTQEEAWRLADRLSKEAVKVKERFSERAVAETWRDFIAK